MRFHQHAAVSAAFSAGIFFLTGSKIIAAASFLAGILVDIDHIPDYWLQHPFKMDLMHFFQTCDEYNLKRTFIFLHSAELFIPLTILSFYTRSEWFTGFTLGLAQHIGFDCIFNSTFPWSYFFFYRLYHGFKGEYVFIEPPHIKELKEKRANG